MDHDKKSPNNTPPNRRGFFREILRLGVDKVEKTAQNVEKKITAAVEAAQTIPQNDVFDPKNEIRYLRPPGTIGQSELERTCCQSGNCVKACPADAIKLDPDKKIAGGFPYIIASESPCVVCDDLACTHVCPSGAISPLQDKHEIAMGYVQFDEEYCLRSDNDDCSLCVDLCPIGEDAIEIDTEDNLIRLNGDCVGCGICEKSCPTSPKSIYIESYEYIH